MFTHKSIEIPEVSTKTVNRKRFYLTPEGGFFLLSQLYYQFVKEKDFLSGEKE